jgi:hypothetical protein
MGNCDSRYGVAYVGDDRGIFVRVCQVGGFPEVVSDGSRAFVDEPEDDDDVPELIDLESDGEDNEVLFSNSGPSTLPSAVLSMDTSQAVEDFFNMPETDSVRLLGVMRTVVENPGTFDFLTVETRQSLRHNAEEFWRASGVPMSVVDGLGFYAMLAEMWNRLMHASNGNRPGPQTSKHLARAKVAAGKRVKARRRHRSAQSDPTRLSSRSSSSSSLATAGGPTSVVVAPKSARGDRPLSRTMPGFITCDDLGLAHYFDREHRCYRCKFYQECDSDGGESVPVGAGRHGEIRVAVAEGGSGDLEDARATLERRQALRASIINLENGGVGDTPILRTKCYALLPQDSTDGSSLGDPVLRPSKLSRKRDAVARAMRRRADQAGQAAYKQQAIADGAKKKADRAKRHGSSKPGDITNKTATGIMALFDDGVDWYAATTHKPDVRSDFNERRGFFSRVHERLGYHYDKFSFGDLGLEVRDLHLGQEGNSEALQEHVDLDEEWVKKNCDLGLYEYLYSKKLPASEYLNKTTKELDRDLLLVHMHKLTDQYYAKDGVVRGKGIAAKQKEAYTQGHVADETTKEFLWSKQTVTRGKLTGFYRACHDHKRLIVMGSGIVALSLLFSKRQCAVRVVENMTSQVGKTLMSSLTKSAQSAIQTACYGSLNRLSSAALRLI